MRVMWLLVSIFACNKDPEQPATPEPSGPIPDPDVSTYYPPSFPATDPVRILFFGDSITRGYGIDNDANTYTALLDLNNDNKWPDFAGDDLRARYGEIEIIDVSEDGATTSTVLSRQLPNAAAALGDVAPGQTLVVGTVGGNDLLDILLTGEVEEGLQTVIDNLQAITDFFLDDARFPDGVYLAIGNVYDPTDGVGQVDECFFGVSLQPFIDDFDHLAAESRAMAERDAWAWVDLRGHFRGHGFRYDEEGSWTDPDDPTLWFQDDCIHPNVRGHHEIRRLFLSALDAEPLPL